MYLRRQWNILEKREEIKVGGRECVQRWEVVSCGTSELARQLKEEEMKSMQAIFAGLAFLFCAISASATDTELTQITDVDLDGDGWRTLSRSSRRMKGTGC